VTLAEVIYQKSLDLSDDKAQEVIDFIESLMDETPRTEPQSRSRAELEERRRKAWQFLDTVGIDFGGKPMTDRDEANARNGMEESRESGLDRLSSVRIHWEGKPIPNRAEFYDDIRGSKPGGF
jgi:hypothetical protein